MNEPYCYCDEILLLTHQGGPHNHAIAGIAVAMKQAKSEEFKIYQRQVGLAAHRLFHNLTFDVFFISFSVKVVKNAQRLADGLMKLG